MGNINDSMTPFWPATNSIKSDLDKAIASSGPWCKSISRITFVKLDKQP